MKLCHCSNCLYICITREKFTLFRNLQTKLNILFLFILAAILLLQPFLRYSAYVERALRSDYFSKVLCEKRAEKQNKCKGKCAVQKKIKQAEKQENTLPASKKVAETEYLPFPFFSFLLADKQSALIFPDAFIASILKREISYHFRHFAAVFHPPAL